MDLLVIADIDEDKFIIMDELRNLLMPIDYAFDVIILTEKEFERDKKYPGTVARYASKEGVLIYEQD